MTEEQVRKRLRKYADSCLTHTAAAREIGVSKTMLSMVLTGRKGVSERIAAHMGLHLVVTTTRRYVEAGE